MKMRTEYTCPLELVHDMIKGKWKPIILWRLRLGATSLAKLEKDIDGITQKMLLEQLKELIDYGGSSVVCVGFKIGIWQHMPRRGISPSWLPKCTGAQGCQGRHGRGVACALTALRHSAAFHPLLCIAHNAGNCCYGWSSPNLSPTHSTEEPVFPVSLLL